MTIVPKKYIILLFFLANCTLYAYKISIVGCGYVGLTLASVLLNQGHEILCVDIDEKKISELNNRHLPMYEPNLQDSLFNSPYSKNLSFTQNITLSNSKIYYICVASPTDSDGRCNCSFLHTAFNDVIKSCNTTDIKVISIKSTVPPGTIRKLMACIPDEKKNNIHIIYNPEFMREGSALHDIYTNNPIVLGTESLYAMQMLEELYTAFLNPKIKIIKTNFETAEMIKYAWNSFSAIRLTYINELTFLCKTYGADITTIIQGLALNEEFLPTKSIIPGPGYGGSCLPKDTLSFANIMKESGLFPSIVHQAIQSNLAHKKRVIANIFACLSSSNEQQAVTLLGLSFKADTNDIRSAPSIDIIQALLDRGIIVKAYDPQATSDMKKLFPSVQYFDSPYDAIKNSDCLVLLTEWQEIKELDLNKVASLCGKKIVIDTKGIWDTQKLRQLNFTYSQY